MGYKFENLEVWQLSLEFVDKVYEVVDLLPDKERHNLRSQMIRAATSISLNVAEGSMSQTDAEFSRFLGIAVRSCAEVVACLHLAMRRKYIGQEIFSPVYEFSERLFAELQALRRKLK